MGTSRTAAAGAAAVGLAILTATASLPATAEQPPALDLPPEEEIEEHKTYDPSPELQKTPGGGIIVNAFIMQGPVRVEVLRGPTGEVVLEKEEQSLFPFEIPRTELEFEPSDVVVRIYVGGELAHELELHPER